MQFDNLKRLNKKQLRKLVKVLWEAAENSRDPSRTPAYQLELEQLLADKESPPRQAMPSASSLEKLLRKASRVVSVKGILFSVPADVMDAMLTDTRTILDRINKARSAE